MRLPASHLLAVTTLLAGMSAVAGAQSPAGTYRLVLCTGASPCHVADSAQAGAWGTLVLLAPPDTLAWGIRPHYLRQPANACFALRRAAHGAPPLAGTLGPQGTFWDQDSTHHVRFALYRSPDAGYNVSARFIGDTLRGQGQAWSALRRTPTGAATTAPRDVVLGVRIGPPDVRACRS
jgi:hypothetical protein